MTTTMRYHVILGIAAVMLGLAPFIVSAQESITDPGEDKLSSRADLEQVITETTYKSAEFLKAKKAFLDLGWPARWSIDEGGALVMPGDRVAPDGAPSTFLKAKKAFDETDGSFEFVMPGDNVTAVDPEQP